MKEHPSEIRREQAALKKKRQTRGKTKSPITGRDIEIGGKTYLKLAKDPRIARHLKPPPSEALRRRSRGPSGASLSAARGGSQQWKYVGAGIAARLFCGPEGGAPPFTYPVNTRERARAALAYARHAPNPEGIRRCVHRIAKAKDWVRPPGVRGAGAIAVKVGPRKPRKPRKPRRRM